MGMLFTILMDFIFTTPNAGVHPILMSIYLGIVIGAVLESVKELYSLYKTKQLRVFQCLFYFFMFCVVSFLSKYFIGIEIFTPIAEGLLLGSLSLVFSLQVFNLKSLIKK